MLPALQACVQLHGRGRIPLILCRICDTSTLLVAQRLPISEDPRVVNVLPLGSFSLKSWTIPPNKGHRSSSDGEVSPRLEPVYDRGFATARFRTMELITKLLLSFPGSCLPALLLQRGQEEHRSGRTPVQGFGPGLLGLPFAGPR